jgi:cytochrome c553
MDSVKYIGMDVHKEAISLAVLNSSGKLVDGVRCRNQGQFHSGQLVVLGDTLRGIPPCQSCHGPVGFKRGAPDLWTQNMDYVYSQLRDFASGARTNDINMPMRSIAVLLTDDERHALAAYYGSGLALLPAGPEFLVKPHLKKPANVSLGILRG